MLPCLFLLLLTACGQQEQRINESRPWIHRRDDVPFAETAPKPSDARIADADAVDALEKLFNEGRDGECRKRLAEYFAQGGDHPRAHELNGRLLALDRQFEGAIAAFNRAVAGSPRWIQPRLALADCYVELDRLGAAASVYAELDRLMPQAPWGPWGQGLIAARAERRDQAIAFLDEALRRDADHPPSLRLRAWVAIQEGDAGFAEALLLRYTAQVTDDPVAWTQLGDLAETGNRLIDAETHLGRAYDLAPSPKLARRIAQICERRGDLATAAAWTARAGGR